MAERLMNYDDKVAKQAQQWNNRFGEPASAMNVATERVATEPVVVESVPVEQNGLPASTFPTKGELYNKMTFRDTGIPDPNKTDYFDPYTL